MWYIAHNFSRTDSMDKIAVIDIGTNTFHLLIVEVINDDIKVILKEKIAVMLGKGGISQSVITEEAQERALDTLNYFREKTIEHSVTKIFASATSAMRNATNAHVFIEKVLNQTGIEINIISGKKEAEFIHRGVRKSMKIGHQPALIADIGGGSVEFIICNEEEIYWLESFEIGAQRLLDKFHNHDPISEADIKNLYLYLEEELAPLIEKLKKCKPEILIGSSGTFDTLVDMAYAKKEKVKSDKTSFSLNIEDFQLLFDEIIHKDRAERLSIPGMIEMRVDMIVVAICLIQFLLKNNQFSSIEVSSYALKEGVLDAIIQDELKVQ